MNNSNLYFIHCMSPVHIGAGQGVGIIDLPIMRERVTEWPFIPGSSVKGVQRDYYTRQMRQNQQKIQQEWIDTVFGRAHDDAETNAGAVVFSDSRLFAFPVASQYGTFAYVTCPLAVQRFVRDLKAAGLSVNKQDSGLDNLEEMLEKTNGIISDGDYAIVTSINKNIDEKGFIYLDEFECPTNGLDKSFEEWMEVISRQIFLDAVSQKMFLERVVMVSDDTFQYFVTMCCEVVTRIRMDDDRKIVKKGHLWTEEYLPVESILYGIVWCDKISSSSTYNEAGILRDLEGESLLQVGGNASVGKGRVRFRIPEGGGEQ